MSTSTAKSNNPQIAIIVVSEDSQGIALTIQKELGNTRIFSKSNILGGEVISTISSTVSDLFGKVDALIFIGAMGICVRSIAPLIKDKYTDPAVVNIDSMGQYVISVLSGHVGGANDLTSRLARILGAQEVISTKSDTTGLWALDTLGKRFGWKTRSSESNFNTPLTLFVNKKKTALLLDIKDKGTEYLERTFPAHTQIFYSYDDIPQEDFTLLIAVTPYIYPDAKLPVIYYHPQVLHLGVGCRRQCSPIGIPEYISDQLRQHKIAIDSLASINTIELKKDEELIHTIAKQWELDIHIYTSEELEQISVPNPSEKVETVTSSPSVSEAAAIRSAGLGQLILEKQKGKLSEGNDFTFAVAIDQIAIRRGHIEIVGAGPGDPELISVRGKHYLEAADLILYAGSLVPIELTHYAKPGAVVRSSADMDLDEQFELMKEFYDKGKFIVRLHTGDPCIYGAIQEQMALFDAHNMSYHITPGISSFQAAAAALRSQFTIPEKVQTIILTRGEGRTPMPDGEKLHQLARSRSTMCIFLSAALVDDVQSQLLEHYAPDTPVAACYKLTWKDERIYRGQLKDLATIVKENKLTLTTLLVVGDAIDNREGLSRLYAGEFKHLFRDK